MLGVSLVSILGLLILTTIVDPIKMGEENRFCIENNKHNNQIENWIVFSGKVERALVEKY